MTLEQFLDRVYSGVRPGMEVQKPRKLSRILSVTESGNIYYLIGDSNKKAVTPADLAAIYEALADGLLTKAKIREIAGAPRPCHVTTIHWMLRKLQLATEQPDGSWRRTW